MLRQLSFIAVEWSIVLNQWLMYLYQNSWLLPLSAEKYTTKLTFAKFKKKMFQQSYIKLRKTKTNSVDLGEVVFKDIYMYMY